MTVEQHRFPPIIGYVTPLRGKAGETLDFKISSRDDLAFSAKIVRIDCADPNPAGPGMKLVPVELDLPTICSGQDQPVHLGSCAWGPLPSLADLGPQDRVVVDVPVRVLSLSAREQVIISLQNEMASLSVALLVTNGRLALRTVDAMQPEKCARTDLGIVLTEGKWTSVRFSLPAEVNLTHMTHISVAAIWQGHPVQAFDGQIGGPTLSISEYGEDQRNEQNKASTDEHITLRTLCRWDFTPSLIRWDHVVDHLDGTRKLQLINLPTRAVKSSNWRGHEMQWRQAPEEYAAIHFHADDLLDCAWKTSLSVTIPKDLPSAVYGLVVDNGLGTDTIPFFVTPAHRIKNVGRTVSAPRILYLASTLTYLAYANHSRGNLNGALADRIAQWHAYPNHPDRYQGYGLSTYNMHGDGSGISLSSRLRPILTMRPGYLTFPDTQGSGMRHFPADSHLTDWLRVKGLPFDVITDEDLDDDGLAALNGYDVVITGSHPEYHTIRMLDALTAYRAQGGNLMYMGGNGFYWKIARIAALPHVLEIRRAEGGIRAWASEPGEYYQQLDGEYGGMWRRNGRAPQSVAGVGFAVQGMFEGSYYTRTNASYAPHLAWIFDGVSSEASYRIGDYGLSGGGAAGFELDQASPDLGTPDGVEIIAVSENHGPTFQIVPEEILTWTIKAGRPRAHEGVRAHMVYRANDESHGGGLFAVGSITFLGSLSHNGYENDISRIVFNVLTRFTTNTAND